MLNLIIILSDYFRTRNLQGLLWNITISSIICVLIHVSTSECQLPQLINSYINNTLNVLSLIIGFSIALFTLIITASNPNIDEMKKTYTSFKISGKEVSLFQHILITMIYIILVECLLLLLSLLFPFFFDPYDSSGKIAFYISIFLLSHIIICNISNTMNVYFVLCKPL
ncbi:hypothetical protein BC792_12060 [Sphingobacterium allocomposti]|uniref:Uncharacterized protein n=1 Tax=Sphingobacterium allocomposti TaxID=415956 RepID=A0A5S5D9F1_9SPHI|nr:hypothetical protein BC792_12060 [Sphingobacterium composti Yoo et al. 2007 non Ten et al. 2007]